MIKEVEFTSQGVALRGLLFLPESQAKRSPIVIMAHGLSATVTMVTDKYAAAFCRAGLAVLLYDHRNFGRSEGEPRQEINPWIQCRGYRDALKFAERLDEVDPERIGVGPPMASNQEPLPVARDLNDLFNHLVPSESLPGSSTM